METTCITWEAKIYIGRKVESESSVFYVSLDKLYKVCQDYCDKVGFCVSFTETQFIYSGNTEPGVIIGLINYPRFPESDVVLTAHAMKLAELLKIEAKQKRCSVVTPGRTYMLE